MQSELDEHISDPEAAIAYWRQRASMQGRKYVVRSMKNGKDQTKRLKRFIIAEMGGTRYDTVLDFGCGWGRFAPLLAAHCGRYLGVDLVGEFRDDVPANASFQRADYPVKIDADDGSIDLVVALLVLQHITSDDWLAEIGGELRRVMRKGAKIVIVDDAISDAPHVRPRSADALMSLLGLRRQSGDVLDLDSEGSHHYIIGKKGHSDAL